MRQAAAVMGGFLLGVLASWIAVEWRMYTFNQWNRWVDWAFRQDVPTWNEIQRLYGKFHAWRMVDRRGRL